MIVHAKETVVTGRWVATALASYIWTGGKREQRKTKKGFTEMKGQTISMNTEGREEKLLEEGDEVLIKGTISQVPTQGRKLYRITRDDRTIVWAKLDEIYVKRHGTIERADFIFGEKSEDDDKRNEMEKFFRGE